MILRKRIALLGLVFAVGACKSKPSDDELVAKINGEGITKVEFEAESQRYLARYKGASAELPPGLEDRLRESIVRRMIDDALIAQKAKAADVTVTDEELNTKVAEYKGRFRTEEAFKAYLTRSNNTEESLRKELKQNLLRDRVVAKLSGDVTVTPEDIEKYYNENQQRFRLKEQIKASRILIRAGEDATPAQRQAALKQAKALHARAAKGEDFATIAKENSQGPEAARGGEVGWFSRGRFPQEVEDAVFTQASNTVSGVLETKLGYEIFKVEDKHEARVRSLDEMRDSIKQSLEARKRNQQRRDVVQSLRSEAKVEQLVTFSQPPAAPGIQQGAVPAAPNAPEMHATPADAAAAPHPEGAHGDAVPAAPAPTTGTGSAAPQPAEHAAPQQH